MDTPPVRYATTSDGARVAYTVFGDGIPLVYPAIGFVGTQLWETEEFAAWMIALGERFRVILLDPPGIGLSDRPAGVVFTAPASVAAGIDAVTEATGAGGLILWGNYNFGPAVLDYAATHKSRVRGVVIFNGYASMEEVTSTSALTGAREVVDRGDTQMWLRMVMPIMIGSAATPEFGQKFATNNAASPGLAEWFRDRDESTRQTSVSADLGEIDCPALIFQSRDFSVVPESSARNLAGAIPKAELVRLAGDGAFPFPGDFSAVVGVLDEHFGASAGSSGSPTEAVGSQTILFTDLEASTPLTQRLGDEGAQEILRGHNASVRGALDAHGGREVKHTGDGIMASFPSAVGAVTAALQIQRELAGGEVRVRVGLNAGEPIAEDDDLFGLSVIKAARVADRAEPGQVLVSNVVRELCEGKRFAFTSLGEVQLKGFDEAVALFEVRGA